MVSSAREQRENQSKRQSFAMQPPLSVPILYFTASCTCYVCRSYRSTAADQRGRCLCCVLIGCLLSLHRAIYSVCTSIILFLPRYTVVRRRAQSPRVAKGGRVRLDGVSERRSARREACGQSRMLPHRGTTPLDRSTQGWDNPA